MLKMFRSSVLWNMVAGFVIGTAGIVSFGSPETGGAILAHAAAFLPII